MNDTILRRFCESSRRGLIVAIVTILLGLVAWSPLVDEYFDNQESRRVLTDDLEIAYQTQELLPKLQDSAKELQAEVTAIESRCISEDSVSKYRSKLVELVRQSGCQVRRLDLVSPTMRPWLEKDNPLEKSSVAQGSSRMSTPFVLESRKVVLSVAGKMQDVSGFLDRVQKDSTLAYPEHMHMRSDTGNGETITLDMEMWLYALGRKTS